MKKQLYLIVFLLYVFSSLLFSQPENSQWRFGTNAGLDFNTTPPTIVNGSAMSAFYATASVSDAAGNLIFYSNGQTVWNSNNAVIANGTNLTGNFGAQGTQRTLAVKKPGSASIYYIFYVSQFNMWQGNPTGLFYAEVDMSQNGGAGLVTVKNVPLALASVSTTSLSVMPSRLTATRHCNGTDIWLVTRDWYFTWGPSIPSNQLVNGGFRSFLITSSGINTTPVLSGPETYMFNGFSGNDFGSLKISPNGKKLAISNHYDNGNIASLPFTSSSFMLFDFDNTTGVVSNSVNLLPNPAPNYPAWGGEFSADGSKFYGTMTKVLIAPNVLDGGYIYQWDLCAGSPAAIAASLYTVAVWNPPPYTFSRFTSAQRASNGKIYLIRMSSSNTYDVINDPNAAGSACNYVIQGQQTGNWPYTSIPNFMSSYIVPHPPPTPFTYSTGPVFGCQTASFNSIYSPNSVISGCSATGYSLVNMQWNFGDPASGPSNISTSANPLHTFSSPGTYTTRLILYYSCGGGTDTITSAVTVNDPCLSVVSSSVSCASLGSATVHMLSGTGPFTFTWMPSAQSGSVATGLAPGNYTISVHNAGSNQTYTASVPLGVGTGSLTASVSYSNSVACYGAATATANVSNVSGGTGSQHYLWSNSTSTFTAQSPVSLSAGNWTVTVIDAVTHCTFVQPFFISQPPALSLQIVPLSPTVCASGTLLLTGLASGGSPGYTYSWVNGPPTATYSLNQLPLSGYSYTLHSFDAHHCAVSNTVAITVVPDITVTVINASVCPTQTGTLFATGASGYTWNAVSIGNSYTASPLATQQYTVVGSTLGCTASAIGSIFIRQLPVITAQISQSIACPGHQLDLQAGGGISYQWNYPNHMSSQGSGPHLVVADDTYAGTYTVTGTDTYGCVNTGTVTLAMKPSPQGYLKSNNMKNCVPFDARYTTIVTNFPQSEISTIDWQVNNIEVSQNPQLNYHFDHAGNYILKNTVISTHSCINTFSLNVIAYPQPKADFSYFPEKPVESFDKVNFIPYQDETTTNFDWYFINNDALNVRRIIAPEYLFDKAGTYPVALLVTNQWGCSDSVVKTITIEPDVAIYVPNAFTPNEDRRNELFYPVMRGVRLMSFTIFDRWGETVFSTNDAASGWDGTYKGEPCKEDAYVWRLEVSATEASTKTNQHKKLTGFVTLYR